MTEVTSQHPPGKQEKAQKKYVEGLAALDTKEAEAKDRGRQKCITDHLTSQETWENLTMSRMMMLMMRLMRKFIKFTEKLG